MLSWVESPETTVNELAAKMVQKYFIHQYQIRMTHDVIMTVEFGLSTYIPSTKNTLTTFNFSAATLLQKKK